MKYGVYKEKSVFTVEKVDGDNPPQKIGNKVLHKHYFEGGPCVPALYDSETFANNDARLMTEYNREYHYEY